MHSETDKQPHTALLSSEIEEKQLYSATVCNLSSTYRPATSAYIHSAHTTTASVHEDLADAGYT
jgi:hypothetical protein